MATDSLVSITPDLPSKTFEIVIREADGYPEDTHRFVLDISEMESLMRSYVIGKERMDEEGRKDKLAEQFRKSLDSLPGTPDSLRQAVAALETVFRPKRD